MFGLVYRTASVWINLTPFQSFVAFIFVRTTSDYLESRSHKPAVMSSRKKKQLFPGRVSSKVKNDNAIQSVKSIREIKTRESSRLSTRNWSL